MRVAGSFPAGFARGCHRHRLGWQILSARRRDVACVALGDNSTGGQDKRHPSADPISPPEKRVRPADPPESRPDQSLPSQINVGVFL